METNKDEYNGWSNYETWVCKLWLDNDQTIYNLMLKLAQNARKEANKAPSHELNELGRLTLDLEQFIESERNHIGGFGLFNDLMNHAIARIDFREIANAYLEDLPTD